MNDAEKHANDMVKNSKRNGKDVIFSTYIGAPDQLKSNKTVTKDIFENFLSRDWTPDQYEAMNNYVATARKKGKTSFGLASMIRLALDGITAFSDTPLRLVSALGLFVSVFSFGMIVYVLLAKWVWHQTISGWASLMVTILFLGGIQLVSIGIIGEYISRINDAVRQRPLYVIAETENDSATNQL